MVYRDVFITNLYLLFSFLSFILWPQVIHIAAVRRYVLDTHVVLLLHHPITTAKANLDCWR